jgi:chloramphenicol-sensitive protein RarD
MTRPSPDTAGSDASRVRYPVAIGAVSGAVAYSTWGLLAIYFYVLQPAGPVEISAWRIVFSVPVAAVLLTFTHAWGRFASVFREPRLLLTVMLGALFLVGNWLLFVIAATTGRVIDASLGYFINPIVTVLMGVVFLRERLRPLQWVAVGVATVAMLELSIAMGSVPWMGILLAVTFAIYSLVKNRTAGAVDAPTGFAVEVTALAPLAVAALCAVAVGSTSLDPTGRGIVAGTVSPWHTVALSASGIITAVPLLLFATASRRLPLSYLGLLQFFTPILQFLTGWAVLGEPMPLARWWGFGLVWIALVIVLADLAFPRPRAPRAAPRAVPRHPDAP